MVMMMMVMMMMKNDDDDMMMMMMMMMMMIISFCDADNVDAVDVADDDKLESEGGKSVQAFKKL